MNYSWLEQNKLFDLTRPNLYINQTLAKRKTEVKTLLSLCFSLCFCTRSRDRTDTPKEHEFESCASTSSAIRAGCCNLLWLNGRQKYLISFNSSTSELNSCKSHLFSCPCHDNQAITNPQIELGIQQSWAFVIALWIVSGLLAISQNGCWRNDVSAVVIEHLQTGSVVFSPPLWVYWVIVEH